MPVFSKSGFAPTGWTWHGARGCGRNFGLIFWSRLRRRALAPTGDIRFERSLEFTNDTSEGIRTVR